MKQINTTQERQPMIVKLVEKEYNGVQSQRLTRYGVGYVLHGKKYIYDGDQRACIEAGNAFCLKIGNHYVEYIAQENAPYEEIIFYYTPADLERILLHLNLNYGLKISNEHQCEKCLHATYISMPAWPTLSNFFNNLNTYLKDEGFRHDEAGENIKMTELIYLITSHEDCCMKAKLLSCVDSSEGNFEQVIFKHVFTDISSEKLAELTHKSLTSFKKEFHRHFGTSPHQWFIRQRLNHARLLLISTNKSVSEIGNECTFPNTSHFIKLFKKEYLMTPALYRSQQLQARGNAPSEEEVKGNAMTTQF